MLQLRAATAACSLLALGACSGDDSRVVYGESGLLAGGQVTTWARIDEDSNRVLEIGATVPMTSINQAKAAEALDLRFPQEVRTATGFDHLGIDFAPGGHGPQPFLVKHFDIHFYAIDQATKKSIDCSGEPMPSANVLPTPYVVPSTATEPNGTCVPQMGVHAIKPTTFSSGYTFEHELILGYHMGKLAFIEPMVTQRALMQRKDFTATLGLPGGPAAVMPWPMSISTSYDAEADAYQVVLSNLVYSSDDIDASDY